MYAQNDHDETIPQDEPKAPSAKGLVSPALTAATQPVEDPDKGGERS